MQNVVLARNCSVFCPARDRCDRCDRFLHKIPKNKFESRQLHLAWDQGQTVSLQSARRSTELLNRKDAKVAKKRNLLSLLLCFLLLPKRCEPKHAAPFNNTHITGREYPATNFLLINRARPDHELHERHELRQPKATTDGFHHGDHGVAQGKARTRNRYGATDPRRLSQTAGAHNLP